MTIVSQPRNQCKNWDSNLRLFTTAYENTQAYIILFISTFGTHTLRVCTAAGALGIPKPHAYLLQGSAPSPRFTSQCLLNVSTLDALLEYPVKYIWSQPRVLTTHIPYFPTKEADL